MAIVLTNKTKRAIKQLEEGPAGERFERLYKKRRQSRHGAAKNWCFVLLGVVIMAIGVVTYPVPLVPSDIVILLGMAVFAQGSRRGARALDWLERKFRRRFGPVLKWWRPLHPRLKMGIGVAWTTAFSGIAYAVYQALAE